MHITVVVLCRVLDSRDDFNRLSFCVRYHFIQPVNSVMVCEGDRLKPFLYGIVHQLTRRHRPVRAA